MLQIVEDKVNIGKRISNSWSPIKSSENHNINVYQWFSVKIIVKGKSLQIYINNNKIFDELNILEFDTGRVGFRNSGNEKAEIKNVKIYE